MKGQNKYHSNAGAAFVANSTKDKGINVSRVADTRSERELILARRWAEKNDRNYRSNVNRGHGVLQDLFISGGGPFSCPLTSERNVDLVVSDESRMVAATVVQWLGSNVGFCFLEESLREMGYRLERPELDSDSKADAA